MPALVSLQQIKLLRLQDEIDEQILEYVSQDQGEIASFNWGSACTRAISTLAASLLGSNRTSIRFIAPQVCPDAALNILHAPTSTLSAVGSRLTSLEINFHSTTDLATSMRTLSRSFHTFFSFTSNLTALHLGFPACIPLNLRLEQIFHRIHWKRLRTLSIQGWRLHSHEIISLVRQYSRNLQNLRLLNIYLKDGERWADVITVLHDEMEQLERIDLREIDYENGPYFNTTTSIDPDPVLSTPPTTPRRQPNPAIIADDLFTFSQQPSPLRSLLPGFLEKLRSFSAGDIEDDGVIVTLDQRIFWTLWILAGPRHIVRRRF